MSEENRKVPKRISQTVLNSLKGGVVPRIGLPYITVGRKNEIEALSRPCCTMWTSSRRAGRPSGLS